MPLGSDNLRLFFTGPYLVSLPLCSVSGVDCPPWIHANFCCLPLCSPVTNCSLCGSLPLSGSRRSTLILGSPYHFRIRRDFMSKNPLSGFAPKQTRLLWRPAPIVLQFFLGGCNLLLVGIIVN